MDLRKFFFSSQSASELSLPQECRESDSETQHICGSVATSSSPESSCPQAKKCKPWASEKRRAYVARLSYKREWEKKYPWVFCYDSSKGMFCNIYQKWGQPSAGSRGAWTTRGLTDWKHATELLKSHAWSKCHKDEAVITDMAQQAERGDTILELHCSAAARELAEKKKQNCEILLKLLRSVYFLVKNRIPHSYYVLMLLSYTLLMVTSCLNSISRRIHLTLSTHQNYLMNAYF